MAVQFTFKPGRADYHVTTLHIQPDDGMAVLIRLAEADLKELGRRLIDRMNQIEVAKVEDRAARRRGARR